MKVCLVDDCSSAHSAKGYCVKHYRRFKKYGDPLVVADPKQVVRSTKRYRNNADNVKIGDVFGYWTISGPYFRDSVRNARFPCVCRCGTQRDVKFSTLNLSSDGRIISCGCYQIEVTTGRGRYNAEVDTPRYNWLRRLWTTYRLTEEMFNALLVSQSGLCGICNNQLLDPYIDHCHETGKVRGLLCHNCNTILGHAKDDTNILSNAITYLRKVITDDE